MTRPDNIRHQIELSIVIPGYNEAEIIGSNLRAVHEVASRLGVRFEILFVNDGSLDNTAEKVQALAGEISALRLISYPQNRGRGHALRQGFHAARGDYILTIESDMNYGDKVIPDLYHAIYNSGNDVVVASPYMEGGKNRNVPLKRILLSKWGNKVLSASLGGLVHTVSGMTRIYSRACIQSLPLNSSDKEIHLEILSKAVALGYKISEIPATLAWPERKFQKTGQRKPSFNARKYILSHLAFTLFERPILLFGVLGLGSFLSGILLGFYIIYLRFTGGLNPNRPLMTLVVLMVLGGIILVSFGLLGMQINDLRKEIYRLQGRDKTEDMHEGN